MGFEYQRAKETVIDSTADKGAQAAVISQGVESEEGLDHFFLEEDRKLKRAYVSTYKMWLAVLLVGTGLATLWVNSYFLVWELAIIALVFLSCYGLYQYSLDYTWKKLNDAKMAVKGVRHYLTGLKVPVLDVFALGMEKKDRFVFNSAFQQFLFFTENSMRTIQISKCDKTITQQGGWNLLVEPSREVLRLEVCQIVPNGENPEVFGLYAFEKFLREKIGKQTSVAGKECHAEDLTFFFEHKDGTEGYCCILARKPDGEYLYMVTADARWKDFPKLWERVI